MSKRIIIWLCVFLIVGCASLQRQHLADAVKESNDALTSAAAYIDEALKVEPQSPAAPMLRKAQVKIADATKAADKLRKLAEQGQSDVESIKKSTTYRLGQSVAGIGVTIALVGLLIVVLRYGGLGGLLASVPILGAVLARIGLRTMVKPPRP